MMMVTIALSCLLTLQIKNDGDNDGGDGDDDGFLTIEVGEVSILSSKKAWEAASVA